MSVAVIGYVLIALALGIIGRRTGLGPYKVFFVSLLLSPILALVYLLFARERSVCDERGRGGAG